MTKTRLLPTAALLVAASALLAPSFGSAAPPAAVTYVVTYDPPGAAPPVESVHEGKVGHNKRLNVVGSGKAELVARFEVLPSGGAHLAVDRLTSKNAAPAALPLAITAVAAIPQSGAQTAAVGYDALGSSAPESFQGDFDFQGGATSIAFASASPGATLDLVASLAADAVRVAYAPVPAAGSATVRAGAASAGVALTSDMASSIGVHAESGAVVLDAAVPDAPASLALDIADSGAAGKAASYQAASPAADVSATLRETSGGAVVQEALLRLQAAPTAVDVQAAGGNVELTAAAPVGLAEVAFARGGGARLLDPLANPAYVYHVDDGTTSSTALRLRSVDRASAVLAGDLSFHASSQAGPLRLLLEDGAHTVDAGITDAPSQIDLAYSPAAGTLAYAASAAIARIQVAAHDPDGLFGRATSVALHAAGLPTSLSLGVAQAGSTLSVDAHGQQVGLFEFTATNGPTPTISSARDGLQLRDQGAPYLVFARLTGLRRASASIAPDPQLFLDASGNRVFEADLNARAGSEDVHLRALLDRVQPPTNLMLSSIGDGSRLLYGAAASSSALFLATNGDEHSDFVELTLAPVPTALDVCYSDGTACSSSTGAANAGTLRVNASEHVTINLFECASPLTGCTPANATRSTALTNLLARAVGLDTHVNGPPIVSNGRVFFDTDNHALTGAIHRRLANPLVRRVDLQLPNGFRAQNRLVTWGPPTFSNPSGISRAGTITCPSGTMFDVGLVSSLTVDVDSIIC